MEYYIKLFGWFAVAIFLIITVMRPFLLWRKIKKIASKRIDIPRDVKIVHLSGLLIGLLGFILTIIKIDYISDISWALCLISLSGSWVYISSEYHKEMEKYKKYHDPLSGYRD